MRTPDEARRGHRRGRRAPAPSWASSWRSASCSRRRCSTRCRAGFVNVHFSLLPRWRGAAPVERAILAGDAETGVSIMAIEAGLDTGPGVRTVRTPIGADETAGELHRRARRRSAPTCCSTSSTIPATRAGPQVGEPTYAEKLTVEEFELDRDPRRPPSSRARARREPPAGRVAARRRQAAEGLARRTRCGDSAALGSLTGPAPHWDDGRAARARQVQPEGKRADAGAAWLRRVPARTRRADRLVTSARREVALEALVRVEEGAYANVVLPGRCARPGSSSASGRSPPSSSTARSARAPSLDALPRAGSTATSTSWTRRCAPRCGSARTSSWKASRRTPPWGRRSRASADARRAAT